ncbi:MAG: EamA family transporter [Candidatus Gottesmanbacteria bacterium]
MKNSTKGALIVALSALFFGSYGVWSKLIGTQIDNLFQVYARSLIILLIIVPFGAITHTIKKVDKGDWKWIIIYTLAGSLTVAPIFYAFNKIGIGSATLLFYASYTIISFILGFISFSEKITLDKTIGLLLALVGLYLIFNLSLQQNYLLAALAAILSGSAAGIEVVFTKKVSDKYSALQLNVFLWLVIFVIHLMGSVLLGERQLLPELSIAWLGIFGYAIASLSAFSLVVIGYRYVQPGIGALTGLLEIIFGIIFGIIFFSEVLTLQIIIGGILIFIAAALPNFASLFNTNKKS